MPKKVTSLGPSEVPLVLLPSPSTSSLISSPSLPALGMADLMAVIWAIHCTPQETLFLLSEEGRSSNSGTLLPGQVLRKWSCCSGIWALQSYRPLQACALKQHPQGQAWPPLKPRCVLTSGMVWSSHGRNLGQRPAQVPRMSSEGSAEIWAGSFPLPPKTSPCGEHRGQKNTGLGPLGTAQGGAPLAWL